MRNDSELKKILNKDVPPKLSETFVHGVIAKIRQNNSYEILATHEGSIIHSKKYIFAILIGLFLTSFFIAQHYQQKSIEIELQKIDTLSVSTLQAL